MKTNYYLKSLFMLYLYIASALCIVSCKREKANFEKGKVTFSYQNLKTEILKSSSVHSLDSVKAVVVSIKDNNNNYIYQNEILNLIKSETGFISSPLSLEPGSYKLSAFMLIDKANNVLFLTPIEGSKYAYLVSNPLEIGFTISSNNTTTLTPEVISNEGISPEDFGYASFSFLLIRTFDVLVNTFVSKDSSVTPANSFLTVIQGNDTVFRDSLSAFTNRIRLPERAGDYQLVAEKPGYLVYSGTFTLDSLKKHAAPSGSPLSIIFYRSPAVGLVLWNKLGSIQEILHSEVGPDLKFYDPSTDGTTDCCDGIAIPSFSKGVYGDALSIAPSSDYTNIGRYHNVILKEASSVINYRHGCIEFWYYQKEDPLSYSSGIYRLWDGYYGFNPFLSFFVDDPSDAGWLFSFIIQVNTNQVINVSYNPGNGIRNNHSLNNHWIHLAAVWDINGIGNSGNTMEIFLDDNVVASGNQNNWTSNISGPVDIGGANDNNISNKFFIDNLKVWNYAKTDFTDRFSER